MTVTPEKKEIFLSKESKDSLDPKDDQKDYEEEVLKQIPTTIATNENLINEKSKEIFNLR